MQVNHSFLLTPNPILQYYQEWIIPAWYYPLLVLLVHKNKVAMSKAQDRKMIALPVVANKCLQGLRKRSGQSGFGRTIISQAKTNFHFYIKQVINKTASVIFVLLRLIILSCNR